MVQHVEFRRKWDSLGPSVECPTGRLSEGFYQSIKTTTGRAHLSIDLPEADGWQTYHHTPSLSGLLCWRAWPQIILARNFHDDDNDLYRDLTFPLSVPRPHAGNNSLVSGCWIVEQGKPPNPFPALSLLVPPAQDEVLAQSRTLILFLLSLSLRLGTSSSEFQPWIGMRIACTKYFSCIRKSVF